LAVDLAIKIAFALKKIVIWERAERNKDQLILQRKRARARFFSA